jgi:hypothetical protein
VRLAKDTQINTKIDDAKCVEGVSPNLGIDGVIIPIVASSVLINCAYSRSLTRTNSRSSLIHRSRLHVKPKEAVVHTQHSEVSRLSPNLFSAEEVAKGIGADLKTVTDLLEVGAINRAVFGGGQFSKYELQRAALVFELVKFGLSPSCAKDVIRNMEYDLQLTWARIPSSFKAYAILIPTGRKWLVSWCWKTSTEKIDPLQVEGAMILPVSAILGRIANETKQARGH